MMMRSSVLLEKAKSFSLRQNPRLLGLLAVIAVLLVMGLYTITDPHRLAGSHVLADSDWMGYALCHRITERSFTINGRQLPLCARCTGMYLGVVIIFGLLWLSGRSRWNDFPPNIMLFTLFGFIGIMGIDGINSYSYFFPNAPHLYQPHNWLRLLTGMGAGLAMGVMMFPSLVQVLWADQERRSIIQSWREFGGVVVVALTAVVLVLSDQPLLLYLLALASTVGVLLIVTSINTILLLSISRRDGQAQNWQQTLIPLSIGLSLTIIELSTISLIRFHYTGTMTGIPGL